MVTELKFDRKVGLAYMKSWEKENYLLKKGKEYGIRFLIKDYLSEGKSEAEIIDKLQKGYELDFDKAKEYFDKYAAVTA